ncbi:hypothetical protein [Rhizobium sp. Root1220]|nr:hypothetical protein [Rhizobium sp. Root1220]
MILVLIVMIGGVLSPVFVAGSNEQIPAGQPLEQALNPEKILY